MRAGLLFFFYIFLFGSPRWEREDADTVSRMKAARLRVCRWILRDGLLWIREYSGLFSFVGQSLVLNANLTGNRNRGTRLFIY